MPRYNFARSFETSPQPDMDSIMLYSSFSCRAQDAQSYPLLTARGSIIYAGANPDPNRAGLSRGDIERIMMMYPKRRVAARQATGGPVEKQETQVTKRWHSIPFDKDAGPAHSISWPTSPCDLRSYVPFCYEDQASQDALKDLFAEGLSKWTQALFQSSLVFAPDVACGPNGLEQCLCSTGGISEDTVHIMLARQGETWPLSTLGYTRPAVPKKYPNMPRHFIQWPADVQKFGARGPVHMAQEIGENPR